MLATCEQTDSDGPLRLSARLLRPPGAVNRRRREFGVMQAQKIVAAPRAGRGRKRRALAAGGGGRAQRRPGRFPPP